MVFPWKKTPCEKIHPQSGFTLIELLIVIAVMGVLATVVLIAINPGAQFAKARDAERKTAVSQLARALDRFYTLRKYYPYGCAQWDTNGGCASASDWRQMNQLVTSGELKQMPVDPINDSFVSIVQSTGYSYFMVTITANGGTAGQYYLVGAFLENTNDPETLGNLSGSTYWPNCTSAIAYNSRIYLKKSYRCPGDP